ncbi:MAG TPA: hypothetical protein VK789_10425 [Bryobacteraceae bacterium]|nr:hypothetical protein [Bryobacteraceae bacterium]
MSIAPLPTPLQHLGGRRFSFYPAIRNLQPNEWLYRRATWSECVVMNARSGEEIFIPRMFLGEVSGIDEPMMIVALNRELEWKSGAIIPRERRVIELPVAVNDNRAVSSGAPRLAPVINIRLEPVSETRTWKWIGVAFVLGAVVTTIIANIAWQSQTHPRPDLNRTYRPWLQLSDADDYSSTVRKMGVPSTVRSRESGGRVFESLVYASRHYSVILMGSSPAEMHYIGTIDMRGRVLDAIRLRDGYNSEFFLHSPALR